MSGRPTVALVAHGVHDGGGMERSLAELVRRGSSRYRFVVLSAELADDLRELVQWQRIRVPMRPIPLKLLAFAALAGLRLSRIRADLVHVCGAIVPNRAGVATVHYCHAGLRERTGRLAPVDAPRARRVNTALMTLLSLPAERWCYRRVGVLAPVSAGLAAELARYFPGVPCRVVPNGVDAARFKPDSELRRRARAEMEVEDDEVVALFVGGNWHHKGLAIAIDAVSRLDGVRLWVVGPGDSRPFRSDCVTFLGPRSDTERFYAAADLFVLPSQYEAFSLVSLEAAAAGLPVVMTPVHGVDELGGVSVGLIVERTPEAVAEAIARLAADPELRVRLGQAGRERARRFTWDASAEAMLGIYDRLLAVAAGTAEEAA